LEDFLFPRRRVDVVRVLARVGLRPGTRGAGFWTGLGGLCCPLGAGPCGRCRTIQWVRFCALRPGPAVRFPRGRFLKHAENDLGCVLLAKSLGLRGYVVGCGSAGSLSGWPGLFAPRVARRGPRGRTAPCCLRKTERSGLKEFPEKAEKVECGNTVSAVRVIEVSSVTACCRWLWGCWIA